jgi:hypothetical protein
MTRRALVVICCVLLSVASIGAQSRGAAADPISGTWEGALNLPMAPEPVAVTFELKFDGKSKVSGTFVGLPNPGEVKAGTFDAKTGALKLELGKTGSSGVLIVLEGSVTKGVATGKVTGEGGNGDFKIAKKAA